MEIVILDARSREAYEAGHVEGALHADLETQLSAPADPARGGRHPLPPVEQWLRQVAEWGITPSTHVVVYDDQHGANAAARVWWMLRAIGHESVEVAQISRTPGSSVVGCQSSGPKRQEPQTTDNRQLITDNRQPTTGFSWQLPTVDMATVDRLRHDPAWRVLDVRAAPRFRGETEPIDPVAGHIPGAINLPYTENIDKSPDELRRMYEELLGDVPPERLIVHCGSGVTACHTLLALDRAGLDGASLYVGSWGEWCRNDMPIAVG